MSRSSFTSIIVVGNPTMLHLLRGCTPHSLGYSPFQPLWMERLTDSAAELGFALPPDTKASFFPLASGFIGADAIAAALAVGLHAALRPTLLVDFGTNGEVMLASDGQIYATATAAGPAFEGVGISYGMPAIPGAIQQVLFNGAPRYRTIGNEQARGLCGSGLIDAVAGFVSNGTVRSDGRIVLPGQAAGNHVLEVAPGITISQQDIRQIQLAIGAIRVAITTLIDVATLLPEEIEYVYLAGGLENKTQTIGNAALQGAVLALCDSSLLREADALKTRIHPISTAKLPGFQSRFVQALRFPDRSVSQQGGRKTK